MERKNIGLIILGIAMVIFIISYFHRSKSSSKIGRYQCTYTTIPGVEDDSTATEWLLTESDITHWGGPVLSEQSRRGRDPFQPTFTKPTKKSASLQKAHFRLEGIIARAGFRKAIINGKIYSVGDWVSGKQVIEIGSDHVILQYSHKRRVLKLFD